MPEVVDKALYEAVKHQADKIYDKSSAYRSGWIVKKYKSLGGRYKEDGKPKNLQRWFKESWKNVGDEKDYPTYRPTKRINAMTPLTVDEIDKEDLKKQIARKQVIKGEKNLQPFKPKT